MENKYSIILPAYNEESGIGAVIDEIKKVMAENKQEYELIVVDDCSTDGTAGIVKQKDIKLLKNPENRGTTVPVCRQHI